MAQPATTSIPAPAETTGNHHSAPPVAPELEGELGGVGILGLVQGDNRIAGEIEVVELNPDGFRFTKLVTKPNANMGWDRVEGGVTPIHADHLTGAVVSEVQIIPDYDTPEGHGEHVRFSLSEEISSSAGIAFAGIGEYQGPVDGLMGRRLPEV